MMDWASFKTLSSFLAVLDRAGAIPSCDTTRKDAFYGASVKFGESHSRHAKFPSPPEKVKALVGFLNYSVGIEGSRQAAGNLNT